LLCNIRDNRTIHHENNSKQGDDPDCQFRKNPKGECFQSVYEGCVLMICAPDDTNIEFTCPGLAGPITSLWDECLKHGLPGLWYSTWDQKLTVSITNDPDTRWVVR
jgi:hypothetical protein